MSLPLPGLRRRDKEQRRQCIKYEREVHVKESRCHAEQIGDYADEKICA